MLQLLVRRHARGVLKRSHPLLELGVHTTKIAVRDSPSSDVE
jgi:hypothetical protein